MNIDIVDDDILEVTESLFVMLTRVPGLDSRITLAPTEGEIEIIDEDGTSFSQVFIICFQPNHLQLL